MKQNEAQTDEGFVTGMCVVAQADLFLAVSKAKISGPLYLI